MNRLLSFVVIISTTGVAGIFPSTGHCQNLTVEMTTNVAFGYHPAFGWTTFVVPSSNSVILSPGRNVSTSLDNVFHAIVNGNAGTHIGEVDLNFLLTFGSQSVSHNVPYTYHAWSQISGPGATGATGDLVLQNPVVFNFDSGIVTIKQSSASINLLGKPYGAFAAKPLSMTLSFLLVPEPSTIFLFAIGAISLFGRRRRPFRPFFSLRFDDRTWYVHAFSID